MGTPESEFPSSEAPKFRSSQVPGTTRTAGVCPALALSAHAAQGCALPATARRPQRTAMWYKGNVFWYVHLCAHMRSIFWTYPTSCLMAHKNMRSVSVTRSTNQSRVLTHDRHTTDALAKNNQFSARESCVDYVWLRFAARKCLKNSAMSAHIALI